VSARDLFEVTLLAFGVSAGAWLGLVAIVKLWDLRDRH